MADPAGVRGCTGGADGSTEGVRKLLHGTEVTVPAASAGHHDAVDQAHHQIHVVLDEQDRQALASQLAQHVG